jgi:hypothetical protein
MADQPSSFTGEEPANPYTAPTAVPADPWDRGDPLALALRRANRKDESYVKGLAIINVLYFLLIGAGAVQEVTILIAHLAGQISAPWILRPARFAMFFFTACIPIAAFGAALGFVRRKRWALPLELAVFVCWFLMFALEPIVRLNNPRPMLANLGLGLANLALAAPMFTAWRLRGSVVFKPEYADAIAATRHIGVWPKIPRMVVLSAIALLLVGGVLVALTLRV